MNPERRHVGERPSRHTGPDDLRGKFPGAGLTAEDLMVVLIFTGPANQTYWAERLVG